MFLVVFLFAGLGIGGWFVTKEKINQQPEYQLAADKITVPERPPWVPDDFVKNVLHASGLDTDGSLFDKEIMRKLLQAFAADAWVEEVQRVELRYPSGAAVQLAYRSPIALVEVNGKGAFPVDRNGVLLPTDFFLNLSPEKRDDFLKIQNIRSMPLGAAGTLWGDTLVPEAAGLAAFLSDIAEKLNLHSIIPTSQATPAGNRVICSIKTKKGTEILWGRYEKDNPKNEVRKKILLEYATMYQSLDDVPKNFQPIDLTKE
jgi:hypothetical protein